MHSHELFNAGHLYEGAVAHYQATGTRSLLDIAVRNADLFCRTFGPGKRFQINHPEIELALVRLYEATGKNDFLELARFLLHERGRAERDPRAPLRGEVCQDHKPLEEQNEALGHAVCAAYTYIGMMDVGVRDDPLGYLSAVSHIWEDIVSRKLYLIGASSARGESFGLGYDLPNTDANNETCSAMGFALLSDRLFLLHGDAKYIDALERTLYNAALSSVSLRGDRFFYCNPMEHDGKRGFNMGSAERTEWMGSACCPTFVVRFIPVIGGFVYATRDDSLYINLFIGGNGKVRVKENTVSISQQTRYPWDGKVRICIEPDQPAHIAVHVRIPGWAQGRPVPGDLYRYLNSNDGQTVLRVNGEPMTLNIEKGFAVIRRSWNKGDTIELDFPMPVRRVLAHEKLTADAGRVALERGPVVYCAEWVDNEGAVADTVLPDDAHLEAEYRKDTLKGLAVIRGQVSRRGKDDNSMKKQKAELIAIPYCAWANRGAGQMIVWLGRDSQV